MGFLTETKTIAQKKLGPAFACLPSNSVFPQLVFHHMGFPTETNPITEKPESNSLVLRQNPKSIKVKAKMGKSIFKLKQGCHYNLVGLHTVFQKNIIKETIWSSWYPWVQKEKSQCIKSPFQHWDTFMYDTFDSFINNSNLDLIIESGKFSMTFKRFYFSTLWSLSYWIRQIQ